MGIERSHSPDYFRKRAQEFRTKAYNCGSEQTRDALLNAAKEYDKLAGLAETIRSVQELER